MSIGVVTDSTADIPVDEQDRYGIEIVPAIINMNGQSFEDGKEISREEFYTRLPHMKLSPTTSTPSVGAFQEKYAKLLQNGARGIVSIHASKNLAGIFNAARLAAEDFGERIKVIDSEQLSLGTGFQVLAAAEAGKRGVGMAEVLSSVEAVRKRVRVAALLESLEYVRRSGRVSWTKAMIGSLLHIRPLLDVRFGNVHRLGQVRTLHQGMTRLEEILNSLGTLERLAILHTNAEAIAHKFMEGLGVQAPKESYIVNVTTAIGTHVGPNGLGFAALPLV